MNDLFQGGGGHSYSGHGGYSGGHGGGYSGGHGGGHGGHGSGGYSSSGSRPVKVIKVIQTIYNHKSILVEHRTD